MKNVINAVPGFLAGLVGYLFGGIDGIFIAVVSVMVLDYITGVLGAIVNKKLDSRVGVKGIAKKIGELVIIALAHIIDANVIGGGVLMPVCEFFFIANEGISIIENLGECGVKVPEKLKNILTQLKEDGGKDDE